MAKKEENKETNMTQENLRFYEQLRSVPQTALKSIAAGRLKGMSDVNPVWRIKAMTEAFGPCGIGWKYEITKQWQEVYGQEVKSFTNINLYIKVDGEWSDPIPGTGGATIVEVNSKGFYVNDEGLKMSLTDALSVAMKALGVAADIYFSKDVKSDFGTKYEQQEYSAQYSQQPPQSAPARPQQPQAQTSPILAEINAATTQEQLVAIWNKYPNYQKDPNFTKWMTARKDQIFQNGKK